MKAKELRINNIVLARGAQSVIKSIEENHIGYSKKETIAEKKVPITLIQPIPLTEEWLLKFGFNKCYFLGAKINYYTKDNIFYSIVDRQIEFTKQDLVITEINYVHQLQNLYYALTGTELTLK